MIRLKIGLGICICLCMASCSSLELGWRAQNKGDYAEAQNQAILALSQEPKNPDVYRLIASTALSKGEFDRAKKAAEFARSLDGGSAKTERLLRKIYRKKSSYADLCDAGNRLSQKGYGVDEGELESFSEAYHALAPSERAYGCLRVLQDRGETGSNADETKVAYVRSSIQKGKIQEAVRVVDTIDDRGLYMLEKARLAFMMQEREEAVKLLNAYAEGDFDDAAAQRSAFADITLDSLGNIVTVSPEQQRVDAALAVYEEFQAWSDAADLMGTSERYASSVRRVISLRQCFRASEANDVLEHYIANEKRAPAEIIKDIENLLTHGYGNDAWRVYEKVANVEMTTENRLAIASLFEESALSSMSVQIVQQIIEDNQSNADVIKNVFMWYRKNGYDTKALAASDVLVDLGQIDDVWMKYRLEVMVNSRAIAQFQTESRIWINERAQDKDNARRVVANFEKKRNNYKAVVELLEILERNNALQSEDVDLYIDTLYQVRKYEKLDNVLTLYKSDIDPQKRAQYFENAKAEVYYKESLKPLLSSSASDQVSACLLLARFDILYKNDIESAMAYVDKALNVSRKASMDSYTFESAISMFYALDQGDAAIDLALKYVDASNRSTESLKLLAEIYLKLRQIDNAHRAFDDYVASHDDTYNALRYVFSKYADYNLADEGLFWLESRMDRFKSQGESSSYARYIDTLADARKQVYIRSFSDEYLYNQARYSYMELFEIDRRTYGVKVLYGLSAIHAWRDADEVCRLIVDDSSTKDLVSSGVFRECLRMAMKAHAPVERYKSIVDNLTDRKDILSAAELLETHYMFYVLRDKLEALISSKEPDVARKAYSYLTRIDADAGDMKSYKRHMEQFEKMVTSSADARLRLVHDAMRIGAYDDAVRLLTALQSSRPDARDVLWAEIELARRAPKNEEAQALLQATIDGAQGVFHRLEWIAQGYAQFGDYRTAVSYAQKAWDTGAVQSSEFRWQLLEWYIASGTWEDYRDGALAHIAALRPTTAWRSDRILAFAQRAFDSGYVEIAQKAIQEAARLAPDDMAIKRYWLERAIDSGDRGQVVLALDNALNSPRSDYATIIDALRKKGAYLDIIDIVDDAIESGNYVVALSTILSILPQYIARYGIEQTSLVLQGYADQVGSLRGDVDAAVARLWLISDDPCRAYSYAHALEDPEIWYDFLVKCPGAYSSSIDAINVSRTKVSEAERRIFDESFINAEKRRFHFNDEAIDAIGIELSPINRFERAMANDRPLDAVQSLELHLPMPEQLPVIANVFAAHGYNKEISDTLDFSAKALTHAQLAQIACARILAGDDEPRLRRDVLRAPETLASLDKSIVRIVVSPGDIEKAISTVPANQADDFLVVMAKSFANSDADDGLWNVAQKFISSLPNSAARWQLFASALFDSESYDFSIKSYEILEKLMPSSDFVDRSYARALAKVGSSSKAWMALERGERCTNSIHDYWKRVRVEHEDSPLELRQKIVERLHALEPWGLATMRDAVTIALEQGNDAAAHDWATKAYEIGGVAAIHSIVSVYERFDKLARLPETIVQGTSAAALMAAARKSFAKGERQQAIEYWSRSFERSAWPLDDFGNVAQQLLFEALDLNGKGDNGFEQITAQMVKQWPFAIQPAVFRVVGELMHAEEDKVPDLSATTLPEARAELVAYAVLIGKNDLARKILDEERKTANFNADAYALAFVNAFSPSKLGQWCPKTADTRLQNGVTFVLENLIGNFKYARLSPANVARMRAWAQSARRDDALRAMIWLDQ